MSNRGDDAFHVPVVAGIGGSALADAGTQCLSVSTYDTDYLVAVCFCFFKRPFAGRQLKWLESAAYHSPPTSTDLSKAKLT